MFQIIRREIVLLTIMAAAAVAMYVFTRKVAEINRHRNDVVAAYWYQQGQFQLRHGKSEAAIASLREAATNDRDNQRFAFALAEALAATNHDSEARFSLLRLREAAPENPQINLELARLSARAADLPEALRYYHHALYGLWTGEKVDEQRREVRLELIHLLLDHRDRSRALAELLVLSTDAPRTTAAQTQLGQLFMDAGDAARSLQHFSIALELDAGDRDALSGAGYAAFQRGDFKSAERYLSRNVERNGGTERDASLLKTARLIESSDPLAAHLTRSEQVRRLTEAVSQAMVRLQDCLAKSHNDPSQAALMAQAADILPRITEARLREDPELLRAGAELVFRIEETTSQSCGEPTGFDQVLLLAGRRHGASER